MAEVKEMNATVNNENTEAKEQENTNPASEATTEEKKDGIFKKHGKKVLVPVGIAAAFAAGIAADKIGLPSFGKKTDAEQTEDQQ